MRHSEITESPCQSAENARYTLPVKLSAGEKIEIVGSFGGNSCKVNVLYKHCDNRDSYHSHKHHHALHKIGQAHGLEAACKGVEYYYQCKNQHCYHLAVLTLEIENRAEQCAARFEAGCDIYREAHKENHRGDNLQHGACAHKAV